MGTVSRTYKRPLGEVLDASILALRSLGFDVTEKSNNVVRASTKPSIWSWGEDIQVELLSTPKGAEVKASSSPKTQLIDWGKSEENISMFFERLEKYLKV